VGPIRRGPSASAKGARSNRRGGNGGSEVPHFLMWSRGLASARPESVGAPPPGGTGACEFRGVETGTPLRARRPRRATGPVLPWACMTSHTAFSDRDLPGFYMINRTVRGQRSSGGAYASETLIGGNILRRRSCPRGHRQLVSHSQLPGGSVGRESG